MAVSTQQESNMIDCNEIFNKKKKKKNSCLPYQNFKNAYCKHCMLTTVKVYVFNAVKIYNKNRYNLIYAKQFNCTIKTSLFRGLFQMINIVEIHITSQ